MTDAPPITKEEYFAEPLLTENSWRVRRRFDGQNVAFRIERREAELLADKLNLGLRLTAAEKQIAELREANARQEAHIEELQNKVADDDCACSYDNAGDVCMGHSPTVKTLREALKASMEANYRAYEFLDANDPTEAKTAHAAANAARKAYEGSEPR
jgi:hypothetical protein